MNQVDLQSIMNAADILRHGGIVVYPTETVYGIGCDPLNSGTCERVQKLKRRDQYKPFILLADSLETVEDFAGKLSILPRRFADLFWPGPLTMVIKPVKKLPGHLYGDSGGVALRVTSHPVAAALSREFGMPVVSTSANFTGGKPVLTFEQARRLFKNTAGIILENHASLIGSPSTVIDLVSPLPKILRVGAISRDQILEVL